MGIPETDRHTREHLLSNYTMEQKMTLIKALDEGTTMSLGSSAVPFG
jgi:hypothetical protein